MPPTVASPQTVAPLVKGLQKLEDFFDKIHTCAESIVDDSEDQDLIDDLDKYLDDLNDRFEKNHSMVLDAIKALDVMPREDLTSARGRRGGAGPAGGATAKLNINNCLLYTSPSPRDRG